METGGSSPQSGRPVCRPRLSLYLTFGTLVLDPDGLWLTMKLQDERVDDLPLRRGAQGQAPDAALRTDAVNDPPDEPGEIVVRDRVLARLVH